MLPDIKLLENLIKESADEILIPRFRNTTSSEKADGSLITEADIIMQQRIHDLLSERWPQYQFLSEEISVDEQQQVLLNSDEGIWCVDPLDGTSNFAAGIPFFAVSVALIVGKKLKLGVIYDPVRKECFSASGGNGAWLNGKQIICKSTLNKLSRTMGLIDFKRLDSTLASRLIFQTPYASQRSFGSVALDWCWLAAGRCHIYLHGKQNIWDYAAGCLILDEAGGKSLTLQEEPIFQCNLQPRSIMAASNPQLFDQWRQWLLNP